MRLLLLGLFVLGCNSDQSLISDPSGTLGWIQDTPSSIVFILDSSCSMNDDIDHITYGLIKSVETIYENTENRVAVAGADSTYAQSWADALPWVELDRDSTEPGWDMMEAMAYIKDESTGGEFGLGAVRDSIEDHPEFFDEKPVFIIASDEDDQTTDFQPQELRQYLPRAATIIGIVGPETELEADDSPCRAMHSPNYHSVIDAWIDVCIDRPWNIYDEIQ